MNGNRPTREDIFRALVDLSALDTLDRLNILQAEIRHMEENIAYYVGHSRFLEILGSEEESLHPEDNGPIDGDDPAVFDAAARSEADQVQTLASILKGHPVWSAQLLRSGDLVTEARRELYLLDALQSLLRRSEYLRRLLRRWWGWARQEPLKRCGPFFLARTGIQHEIYRVVPRLGDLQRLHESSLDLAQTEPHRPIGTRRRLQGVYSRVLQDSARAWRDAISELLDAHLGSNLRAEARADRQIRQVLTHRWLHDHSSRYHRLVALGSTRERRDPDRPDLEFVNSSYWMPDRPDLQPQIVHETAHLALDRLLDIRVHPTRLDRFDGPLARLLTRWWSMIVGEITGTPRTPEPWLPFRQPLHIAELAADLLAATVAGPAFLHALFLDLVGRDLERWLAVPDFPDISLQRATDYLDPPQDGGRLQADAPFLDWYVRLRLVAAWLDRVHPPAGPRDRILMTDAVRELCTHLLRWVRARVDPRAVHFVRYWEVLAAGLERELYGLRGGRLTGSIRRWVAERRLGFGQNWDGPASHFPPRFLQAFPPDVSRLLRAAGGWKPEEAVPRFAALRDVPWETVWVHLTAPNGSAEPPPCFAEARRLHQLALEFHLWESQRPWYRLSDAVATVERAKDGVTENTLRARLDTWLDEVVGQVPADSLLGQRPPIPLEEPERRGRSSEKQREVDRKHGEKLEELMIILRESANDLSPELRQLHDWLHLRSRRQHSDLRRRIIQAMASVSGAPKEKDGEILGDIRGSVDVAKYDPKLRLPAFREITTVVVKQDHRDVGAGSSFVTLLKPGVGDVRGRRRQAVALGRFDIVSVEVASFHPYRPFLSWKWKDGPDLYLPYSRHMEIGLRLSPMPFTASDGRSGAHRQPVGRAGTESGPAGVANGRQHEPPRWEDLAALAIVLRDRSQRLDFVGRLLQAIDRQASRTARSRLGHAGPSDGRERDPLLLEECVGALRPHDIIYLTEGTGDVLLVFRVPQEHREGGSADRLRDVMCFTVAAFEDFMVDRTELVLFAPALWAAVEAPDRYAVQLHVRLQERPRSFTVTKYLEFLAGKTTPSHKGFCVVSGRDDVLVEVDPSWLQHACASGKSTPIEALYRKFFDPGTVNHISTVVRFMDFRPAVCGSS